ncbi:MAG: sulfatase family protein [Promethearchaeota archaeon]
MTDKKPNIILITSDQQHHSTIGKLNPEIKTPHLDKLADEGILFTNAYCTDPTCTPSRASILTGKYPSQHGAWSLGTKLEPEKNVLLTDLLKKAGYRTSLIGKVHLEPLKETEEYPSIDTQKNFLNTEFWRNFHGPYYGFDYVEMQRGHGNSEVGQHYAIWLEEKLPNYKDYFVKPEGNMPNPPILVDLPQKWKLPAKYHHSRFVQERSIAQLEKYKESDDPFFMWVSFPDPHYPNICPEPWYDMYDPESLTIPTKIRGEHQKSNPFLKYTQKPFLKFILCVVTRIQMLFWKQKLLKMENGIQNHKKHKVKKERTDDGFDIEKIIKRLSKFPLIRRIFRLEYYTDFIKNGQQIQGIHGLHPHVHIKSLDSQALATIYGSVSLMDDCIGKILKNLEKNQQENDTIIIFTSDHGDHFGQHGLFHKGPFPYDDGQKVPFIVKIPGAKKSGKISTTYVSLMDIAPTILSLADIDIPEEITGVDQGNVDRPLQDCILLQ